MAAHPLISVIIPNWNGAVHLPTCLSSLRAQTYPNFEVILVDNASTDESLDLVYNYYPEVRVVPLPENRGLTGGVNAGFLAAKGDILVALNNDTETDPHWLEEIERALAEHPEAGMAASKMLLFDRRNTLHSAGDGYGIDGIPINRGVWEVDKGQFDGDTYCFGACGGAAAYRRAMIDEVGLFDESLFMYLEDVDLAWRGQLAGYRCVFAPKAIVYHKLSATGGGPIASFYVGRNTLYVLFKDVPSPILRRYWGQMARAQWRIFIEALRAWRGEAARARLRGQIAGLLLLPRALQARPKVQATRRVSVDYVDAILTRPVSRT
ncbi:MAG: glycosyltransferase family 2 protein [Chloroflexi bacterium]|nr:glycosyltransferase family 2 protein [Chloroflexota bacterium]